MAVLSAVTLLLLVAAAAAAQAPAPGPMEAMIDVTQENLQARVRHGTAHMCRMGLGAAGLSSSRSSAIAARIAEGGAPHQAASTSPLPAATTARRRRARCHRCAEGRQEVEHL